MIHLASGVKRLFMDSRHQTGRPWIGFIGRSLVPYALYAKGINVEDVDEHRDAFKDYLEAAIGRKGSSPLISW